MRLAILGAGGFLGSRLARIAASDPRISDLVLNDLGPMPEVPGSRVVPGSFADAGVRAAACEGADAVVVLGAVLGGAAEANRALGRRINIEAMLDLLDHLSGRPRPVRIVFASSVAVFGADLPDPVNDSTPTEPMMLYGAQKLMIETALAQASRRGWVDGLSLRPAGVVARDGADAGLKSAFLSRLFWAVRRGEDITLPVAPEGRTWLTSAHVAAGNFLHAALLGPVGARRALTLPALALTYGEAVAALRRAYPDSPSRIEWHPEPEAMALFGRSPGLVTEAADALGFTRDAGADGLVAKAFL